MSLLQSGHERCFSNHCFTHLGLVAPITNSTNRNEYDTKEIDKEKGFKIVASQNSKSCESTSASLAVVRNIFVYEIESKKFEALHSQFTHTRRLNDLKFGLEVLGLWVEYLVWEVSTMTKIYH